MSSLRLLRSLAKRFAIALIFTVAGCVSGPDIVYHAFGFDALRESPDVYVLDYKYGDSQQPTARNPEALRAIGESLQVANIFGDMRRPDFLYVRWRIKSTGREYEDNVDLRKRLPDDLENKRVYFVVDGPQLSVYLISKEFRRDTVAPTGPRKFRDFVVKKIYP